MVLVNSALVKAGTDSYESNDTIETAAFVYPQYVPVKSYISNSNDNDYFRFTPSNNGYMTLQLTPPSGKSMSMVIYNLTQYAGPYDETKKIIGQVNVYSNSGSVRIPVTKNVDYYIWVVGDYSNLPYEIKQTSFIGTYDAAYEDNDNNESAFEVEVRKNINATISSNRDVDYYKFTSDVTGPMNLELLSTSNKNYDMFVLDRDNNGALIGSSNLGVGQADSVLFNAVNGKTYTVIIHSMNSGDYCSGIPYTLFWGCIN
jgi:hypothetical protein